jgi:RNA polymerase sigma factor (sigma-70 family)
MQEITAELLKSLFESRDPLIYGTAWKILRNEADVEECTQAFCEHALEHCVNRTPKTTPRNYLVTAMWNFAVRFKREKLSYDCLDDNISETDQSLDYVDAKDFVERCIQRLPRGHQEVLEILLVELTPARCAEKRGVELLVWNRQLHEARKRLKAEMEKVTADRPLACDLLACAEHT